MLKQQLELRGYITGTKNPPTFCSYYYVKDYYYNNVRIYVYFCYMDLSNMDVPREAGINKLQDSVNCFIVLNSDEENKSKYNEISLSISYKREEDIDLSYIENEIISYLINRFYL